jgi:hypothetical protein
VTPEICPNRAYSRKNILESLKSRKAEFLLKVSEQRFVIFTGELLRGNFVSSIPASQRTFKGNRLFEKNVF